jgi:mono/diheme cytochrome c family protein
MLLSEGTQGLDRYEQVHAEAFPTGDEIYDRELARLLVARGALGPAKLFPYLSWGQSQETRIHYAMLLAECAGQMDLAQAMAFFMWEHQAKKLQGGLSVGGFIDAIAKRASENMQPEVLAAAKDGMAAMAINEEPPVAPVGREFVRDWSLDELTAAIDGVSGNPDQGAIVFGQALCLQCHRVAGQGGSLGPDLTAASRRFSQRDLLEAIIDPMKDRSDQYGNLVMPPGLLNTFSSEEVADLMAYMEAAR